MGSGSLLSLLKLDFIHQNWGVEYLNEINRITTYYNDFNFRDNK